jgi:dethiobiotin synthetase
MKWFITGTDTGIGKTYVSVRLLHAFQQLGFSTLGIKPIASGCTLIQNKLYHDDALALQRAASLKLPYTAINPFAFEPAIAPHLAACRDELNIDRLTQCLKPALQQVVDICLIEGAGGWYTPLNATETLAHLVIQQHWPVVLVVGMQLGCLNHALLTQQALQHDQASVIGWIANCLHPHMDAQQENISTLKAWLSFPYLGTLHYQETTFPLSASIRRYLTTDASPEEKA